MKQLPFFVRVSLLQERLALPFIAIPLLVYLITWNWEPYAFGFSVLILSPIQLLWGVFGLLLILMDYAKRAKAISVLVNITLIASAICAFLALKSINWA